MFNVTKALKKLDEYPAYMMITISHVREILIAGQEDEVENPTLNAKETRVWLKEWVTEQVHNQNRRIGEIEAKIGTELLKPKVKAEFEKIEERLARLEEDITRVGDRLSDHIEPEKPVTDEKYKHQEFKNEPFVGSLDTKPEKTVTDVLSIGHLSDIGAFKQKGAKLKPVTEQLDKNAVKCANCGLVHDVDYLHACPEKEIPTLAQEYIMPSNPSEFDPTTFDAVKWAEEYRRINPECDRDTMLAWFASAIMAGYDEAYRRNNNKDTISIPRSVAEKAINGGWMDFCNLWNAIKQALKG